MEFATITWLSLGFGLGLVHAFDADHVAALSVFSTRRHGASAGARAGLGWALGHGAVILVSGFVLLYLGRGLAPEWSAWAERGVGAAMIGLGLYVWWELARRRAHLHFHEHDDLPRHAHWHRHGQSETHDTAAHDHEHGPVMVGALHGLAGSAPVLAVLPATTRSPELGIAYLTIFALGVALAMAAASGLMGHFAGRLSQSGGHAHLSRLRAISASGSIGLGVWLVAIA